ncbi:MAG: RluA family pseudouridine synthase [Thermodesulfobacteriota bacterium]|nr:RluA family pseudouridine synthase [Thermodesulfobacteriota bacterium]
MDDNLEFYFEPGQSVERLDRFLSRVLPDISRSQLKKLIDQQQIVVDGDAVKAGLRLRGGETVVVTIPPVEETDAVAQDIPLEILYEDCDLIVINKAAGMVVHPACGHASGTLVNALLFHCGDLSGINGEMRPGIVHRLDKDTSGVMVATKNDTTHNHLAAQFKAHSINRRYVALVHGRVQDERGIVDQPIGRHPTQRKKMSSKGRNGRNAVTHWKVLRRYDSDSLTLLEMRLETGRTHQIRVHFSEQNLPLVGDPLYGNKTRINAINDIAVRQRVQQFQRQALHARLLGFIHPRSCEYMEFTTPIPEDMAGILALLDEKYGVEKLMLKN